MNVPSFIADIDNILSCQTHYVKQAMSAKHCKDRISKEDALVRDYNVGDVIYKRSPGINKCLDDSWEGPFTIVKLLPPVNCAIVPQGSKKVKSKVIHLSQVKKSLPINRALIIPDEDITDDF